MKRAMQQNLDFDYLTGLAKSNPSEFERLRQNAIDAYILTLPDDRQARMRRLQWRIDQVRSRHSPMGACVRLSTMMWDHLLGPQGLLGLLHNNDQAAGQAEKADIIPFPQNLHR
ncbi:MAG: DUF3135 domain-containing protein [Candidatus Thiodiazotropha sp. (ex Notomyrtea botanica)]|nr:DUF3135 domain-containing protein [Candidatus Thiodiazotropha sp. (ex Notomyrtea botanica)]